MEIVLVLLVLAVVGYGIYYFTRTEDVVQEQQETSSVQQLPRGYSPSYSGSSSESSKTYQSSSSQESRRSSDDGFGTSLAVAAVTDSALLGVLAGGNLGGALLGDALNNSDEDISRNSYSSPVEDTSSSSSSSDSSYDSSSSSSDSSYDSGGSSYDSGSSDSGSFDSGGSFGD